MADYNLKVITADTDGPSADTELLFGSPDQSSGTPKPYSFAGIKTWSRSWSDTLYLDPPIDPDFNDANIYLTNACFGSSCAAGNMLPNILFMIPIRVPRARTYTTYALAVTTSTPTSVIRLGLYNANSALQPTTKIDEIGTPLDGTTNALKTGAFGVSQALQPGLYFIAAVTNVTTPVVRANTPAYPSSYGALFTATAIVGNTGKSRSFTYAALPADETAQSYTVTANGGTQSPVVGIR